MSKDDAISHAGLLDLANAIESDDSGYWTNKRISSALRNISSVTQKPIECDDAISREALVDDFIEWREKLEYTVGEDYSGVHLLNVAIQKIWDMPSVNPQKSGKWIALVARPMTNEEREYYSDQLDYCDGDAAVYDCPLPEEGQDVLITTCTGGVLIDTFFNDYDGCGFEGYDIEDVKAWMPLPEPYEPQESEDKE